MLEQLNGVSLQYSQVMITYICFPKSIMCSLYQYTMNKSIIIVYYIEFYDVQLPACFYVSAAWCESCRQLDCCQMSLTLLACRKNYRFWSKIENARIHVHKITYRGESAEFGSIFAFCYQYNQITHVYSFIQP